VSEDGRVPLPIGRAEDIDERYVAALILLAEISKVDVEEAHQMVDIFLEEVEVNVDRTSKYYTDSSNKKRSLH